jgi:membrane protein DedA with SNARE-associated domain
MKLEAAALAQWIATYGYPALALLVALAAAGVPLPFPVAAAFVALGALTAAPRGPSFLVLALVAIPAAAAGHSLDYWLGRAGSPLLRRWLARIERGLQGSALLRGEQGLARNGSLVILLTRFLLTPIASPVSALAGAARVPFPRYLMLELVGQAIYFCGYLALGRALGPAVARSGLNVVLFFGVLALVILAPAALLRLRLGVLRRPLGGPATVIKREVAYALPAAAPLAARRRATRPRHS